MLPFGMSCGTLGNLGIGRVEICIDDSEVMTQRKCLVGQPLRLLCDGSDGGLVLG